MTSVLIIENPCQYSLKGGMITFLCSPEKNILQNEQDIPVQRARETRNKERIWLLIMVLFMVLQGFRLKKFH